MNVFVRETPKPVTPFGGLISFVAYLEQIGFGVRVAKAMPFPAAISNNAIPLALYVDRVFARGGDRGQPFRAYRLAARRSCFAHYSWHQTVS